MSELWTSLKLIQWTTDYFQKAGIPNPRLDAELLLAHVLKCQRIDLYTRHEALLREKHLSEFKTLLQRRIRREPLQYIIGETEFYGLKFKVTPTVLIPRPETELLVEEAAKILRGNLSLVSSAEPAVASPRAGSAPPALSARPKPEAAEGRASESFRREPSDKHPHRILDIGTGSGCIAITLAKKLPEAKIVATDISKEALEIARENASRHEVSNRIEFILSDIAPWRRFTAEGRTFDLIVSNPPYIPTNEFSNLQPEVRDFEPHPSLDGGCDGLDFYRRILQDAVSFLNENGVVLVEIGEDQAEAVSALVAGSGLHSIEVKKDYANRERIARGTKVLRPDGQNNYPRGSKT